MSEQPYIGLRAFERNETDIFFGRKQHRNDLINCLGANHFLAVIGTSGCGKSSLVKTGLIPGLEAGYLAQANTHWKIVEMRPGNQPFKALAENLWQELSDVLAPHYTVETLQQALRQGSLSLHELLIKHPLPNNAQLLIVCDQFEEIFRYFKQGESAEASLFVSLLLASSQAYPVAKDQALHSIYVVITMRSDYLGDCAQFAGLAEAINQGLYLTPRLNPQQLRSAIEEPAFMFDGEVEPELVVKLLEDAEHNQDQLPLLQHILMRLWNMKNIGWAEERSPSIADDALPASAHPIVVKLADYEDEKIQTLKNALSTHADEAFNELTALQKNIAKQIFCRLTSNESGKSDTRNPATVQDLMALTGQSLESLTEVLKPFRQAGRCFLMPPLNVPLTEDSVIDISHESLIRQWQTLQKWVTEEAQAAQTYRHLLEGALRYRNNQVGLLQEPELGLMLKWWADFKPTLAWANRYGRYVEDFSKAEQFLNDSQIAHQQRLQNAEQQMALTLKAISNLTYEFIDELMKRSGTLSQIKEIIENNIELLDTINTPEALREKSVNFNKLADVYLKLNQTDKALTFYQQSQKNLEQIAKDDSNNTQSQQALSVSLIKLGDIHLHLNQTDKALTFYQDSLKIREQIAKDESANAQTQRDLSVSFNKLADVYLQLNDTQKALVYYQDSHKIFEKIAKQDPQNSQAQQDLAFSYERMGEVNLALGKTQEALSEYQKEFAILKKLADDDKNNMAAQRAFSVVLNKLANVYLQLNDTQKALAYYQDSLKIREQIAKQDPRNSQAQRDLFVSFINLGDLEKQRKNKAAAKAWFAKALPIAQKLAADKMNYLAQEDLKEVLNAMKGL